jgi:hypothetical protein
VLAVALLLPDAAAADADDDADADADDALETADGLLRPLENLYVGSRDTGFSGAVRVSARTGVIGTGTCAAFSRSITLVLDGRFLLRAAFEL